MKHNAFFELVAKATAQFGDRVSTSLIESAMFDMVTIGFITVSDITAGIVDEMEKFAKKEVM